MHILTYQQNNMKQKVTELKGTIDSSVTLKGTVESSIVIIVGDFSTPLSIMVELQRVNK